MGWLLGIDLGSSFVKASLLDSQGKDTPISATSPAQELPISSQQVGFAEQDPNLWWKHVVIAVRELLAKISQSSKTIEAIGIAYQMHGLVAVDESGSLLRPAIIWCDGRAVETGAQLLSKLNQRYLSENLLNAPANFTLSKLMWVKENEPQLFDRISNFMLPGDYIAYRLSGEINTTNCGLSEGILYDFQKREIAKELLKRANISEDLIPKRVPTFGLQGKLSKIAAAELGLPDGIPLSYRAGDQPNNALSLGALSPGDVAVTAGTSGVVYAVTDKPTFDPQGRVNTFLHVNDLVDAPKLGVLMCINGAGILNRWVRDISGAGMTYAQMDSLASKIAVGSDGVTILPFGNGTERTLGNLELGGTISGLNFSRHSQGHIFRAAQEGVAFAIRYGIDILRELNVSIDCFRAGNANMFLSPVFASALVNSCEIPLEVSATDGSFGAALAAGYGAGLFPSLNDALSRVKRLKVIEPEKSIVSAYKEPYERWRRLLQIQRTQ